MSCKNSLPLYVKNSLPTYVKNCLPCRVKFSLPCDGKIILPRTIQAVRSTQNQYNFIERDFDTAELKRNLVVDGRNKLENEQILMIVDAINDAINQRRKIRFQKVEYNVNEGLEV